MSLAYFVPLEDVSPIVETPTMRKELRHHALSFH
jgi:hypothetical protein